MVVIMAERTLASITVAVVEARAPTTNVTVASSRIEVGAFVG